MWGWKENSEVKSLAGKMPRKGKKNKTIEGYFLGEQTIPPLLLDEEEQCLPSGKDTEVKASVSQTSRINIPWALAMEELKKNFETQVREVEEKLGREMRDERKVREAGQHLAKGDPKKC